MLTWAINDFAGSKQISIAFVLVLERRRRRQSDISGVADASPQFCCSRQLDHFHGNLPKLLTDIP